MKNKLIIGLLILKVVTASATNFFVSPTGVDLNPGTKESPFKTILNALSYAKNQGDTIFLSEGIFVETSQIIIPKGVSLIGSGKSTTAIKVNFYYDMLQFPQKTLSCTSLINPDMWSYNHRSDQFVIQVPNGENQVIKGFSLDGQDKKCHGGIFSDSSKYVDYNDLKIENFRFGGIWLNKSKFSEIQNCTIRNNTFGNSLQGTGNIMFYDADDTNIHDNFIEETVTGCYGIKNYSKRWTTFCSWTEWATNNQSVSHRLKIYNNVIKVKERGQWQNGLAPAITIEFCGVGYENCEIYNNYLNNHTSLTGNYVSGDFWVKGQTMHVYNNYYDLGIEYRYAVEANTPRLEFDHNYINGGYYPIAQWESTRTNFVDHYIHHNVFYAPHLGQPLLLYMKDPGIRFENNTVVDTQGISTLIKPQKGSATSPDVIFDSTVIKKNIFMSTLNAKLTYLQLASFTNLVAEDNLFYNVIPFGSTYIEQNPKLRMAGDKPLPYFSPQKDSPVVEKSIGAYLYNPAYDFASVDQPADQQSDLKVFFNDGKLFVVSLSATDLKIYSISGMLLSVRKLKLGTNSIQLPSGVYIFASGKDRVKIAV